MARGTLLSVSVSLLAAPTMAVAAGESLGAGLARCSAIVASETRLACYDALAGRHAAVDPTGPGRASVAPAESAPADPVQNFGLSATQQHEAPQELPAIQARVTEVRMDQLRRGRVVLDNGQVWASLEGEMQLNAGEAVTIRRAALGSFMLITASKHAYRVRRLR